MFSSIRQGWVYAPVYLKALGSISAQQLPGFDNKHAESNNITTRNSNINLTSMTKMIPAEIPVTASSASTTDEAVVPTASYITIPTFNGVLDLSSTGTATTLAGSNLVITPESLSAVVQDLSSPTTATYFTLAPSIITDTSSNISEAFNITNSVTNTNDIHFSDNTIITTNSNTEDNMTIPETVTSPTPSSRTSSIINEEEEEIMDPTVVQAAYSAAQSGLLTPLIKEELRCTIQTKRLKKGEDELVVEEEPLREYELTPEDEERISRRRERNKVAAQKCRNKRKQRMDVLENETVQLENSNSKLKQQIKQLEVEKQKLTLLLKCHDTSFHNCPQSKRLSTSEEEDRSSWNLRVPCDNIVDLCNESTLDGFELKLSDESDDGCSQDSLCIGQEVEVMDITDFDVVTTQ